MNVKENISNGEFQECMEVVRNIGLDSDTTLQLAELAKSFWLRGSTTYVSTDDLLSLLELGEGNIPFKLNFEKKNRHGTTSNGLGDRAIPQLVEAGMITKDTSGRYTRYTVQKTGMAFILWWVLKCNSTLHTSRQSEGETCWNCNNTLENIGGLDGLLALVEATKQVLIN